jgi:hypothetical protein
VLVVGKLTKTTHYRSKELTFHLHFLMDHQ